MIFSFVSVLVLTHSLLLLTEWNFNVVRFLVG
jgi:hypothetical protein